MKKKIDESLWEGEFGKYRSVGGKYFDGYELYEDGRVRLPPFVSQFNFIQDSEVAIQTLERFFLSYVLEQRKGVEKWRRDLWDKIQRELKTIAPQLKGNITFSADGFIEVGPTKKGESTENATEQES